MFYLSPNKENAFPERAIYGTGCFKKRIVPTGGNERKTNTDAFHKILK